jgi:hypothetical protein
LEGIYLTMQRSDWLIVEVSLARIGLTKSLLSKTGFDLLGKDQSSFLLSALAGQVAIT